MSSLEFINQGIDSWFKVEVKQGLNDALGLSRAALDLRMREYSLRTVALAETLAATDAAQLPALLNSERRISQALEITLFGRHGRIIAASLENALEALPSQPPPDLLRQVEQQRPYVSLEPQSGGRYLIRTAAALPHGAARGEPRYVVAIYPVPAQLAALSEAVQDSYNEYGNLAAMREPLKYSFRLTLTLVRAARHAGRRVPGDLLGAAPGAPGAGPDRRHACRGQGRLRHAPAAALAR